MEKFKRIAIWSIVIFVVAGISFQTYRAATYEEPVLQYSTTKGPLDINLVALRHDSEPDFYDVYGKKIELTVPGTTVKKANINSRYYYSMEFVFEIPRDIDIFFPAALTKILTGKNTFGGFSQGYRIIENDGQRLLIVNSMFINFVHNSSIFGSTGDTLSYIGLDLMYYHDRGKGIKTGNVTYKGPFQPGMIPKSLPNLLFNEDVTDDADRISANFDLSGFNNSGCIIVYDKDAKPHPVTKIDNKGNPWSGNATCFIEGPKLSEIDSIEFRRNFDTQSFNNIKINPPKN